MTCCVFLFQVLESDCQSQLMIQRLLPPKPETHCHKACLLRTQQLRAQRLESTAGLPSAADTVLADAANTNSPSLTEEDRASQLMAGTANAAS